MAGLAQAASNAAEVRFLDTLRSDRTGAASRGRIFDKPGQLLAGLRIVQAKLRTSRLRDNFHSDNSVVVDDQASDEEGEEGEGGGGRGARVINGGDVALPEGRGWERRGWEGRGGEGAELAEAECRVWAG